ncbi:PEF-CTERM sorting domain-containing protein [uncultured Methanolobus sp.]|uniref:PEF-CTERM sorting domain-containing protein n=1 Tax=uncultured Methanolobus sp. TaxID=218300 RepID=UPI002AAAB335|nr:PEF-CTERM sorting domain-containing protein [uncultured Methanolobus sp.]
MKNILITLCIVLIACTGFASASTTFSPSPIEVNVINNAITTITVTHTDNLGYATNCTFYVRDDASTTINDELIGCIDGATWGNELSAAPSSTYMDGSDYVSEWTFKVKDNGDSDDDTQVGTEYDIHFVVDVNNVEESTVVSARGSSTSDVTAVPEFPTIALPVAAILGIAFFMQRRKDEDE